MTELLIVLVWIIGGFNLIWNMSGFALGHTWDYQYRRWNYHGIKTLLWMALLIVMYYIPWQQWGMFDWHQKGSLMDRIPLVFPVIHFQSTAQVMRNAEIVFRQGCTGVFVINMDGGDYRSLHAASCLKYDYPDKKIGVNLLQAPNFNRALTFSVKAGLDMTWTDEQLTHSSGETWQEAAEIGNLYPDHLKFIGVRFKYQPTEFHPELAAKTAVEFGFIPTTSGPATGKPADATCVQGIKRALPLEAPFALASGITPENVTAYARHVSHLLVSTGISDSFYEISEDKLATLNKVLQQNCWPYYTPCAS